MTLFLLAAVVAIAGTGREAAAGQRTPVVFVPGFLGSVLHDDRGELWGSLPSLLSRASDLRYTKKPRHGAVRATGLVSNAQLFGFLQGSGYRPVLRLFRELGFKRGRNFFIFPYDWRRSNFDTARELAAFVDRTPALRQRKFNLVAFSMGGVASSIYMARHGGHARVKYHVTLGTPHLGSAKVLRNFLGLYSRDGMLAKKVLGAGVYRRTLLSFPSLYELLPFNDRACIISGAPGEPPRSCKIFEPRFWSWAVAGQPKLLPAGLAEYLGNAKRLHKLACGAFKGQARRINIAGSRAPTIAGLILEPQGLPRARKLVHLRGDGSVAEYSASCGDVARAEIVFDDHLGLLANRIVRYRLARIALDGVSDDPFAETPKFRSVEAIKRKTAPLSTVELGAHHYLAGSALSAKITLVAPAGEAVRGEIIGAGVLAAGDDSAFEPFMARETEPGVYHVKIPLYRRPGIYRFRAQVPGAGNFDQIFAVFRGAEGAAAKAPPPEGDLDFDGMAREILDQLAAAPGPAKSQLRLAMGRPEPASIPIVAKSAARFDARLRRALIRNGGGRVAFPQSGAATKISGRIEPAAGSVFVSYRAISASGANIGALQARTTTRRMPIAVRPGAALKDVIADAAGWLSRAAPPAAVLAFGGITYQDSGIRTGFGRHVARSLAAARRHPPSNAGAPAGGYRVSGRYWNFDTVVALRLSLAGPAGARSAWWGHFRRDSVPRTIAVAPAEPFGLWREHENPGPLQIRLTSDRGRDPSFRLGETLNLNLRTDRDAFVYCFYRQADGGVFKILPNRFHRSPRLTGGREYRFPANIPIDIRFVAPAGIERVKCFATSRDVTAELPGDLRGLGFAVLPPGTDMRLVGLFRRLPQTRLSEAGMVITVRR